jgi:mannonate dehydratase
MTEVKITNLKAICTAPEGIRLVVVKVETSEPGLYGLGDVSPVGHAANLQLDLACHNFGVQEQHVFTERAREVFRDGYLWPSDQPGLGIDIDERLAAKYPFPEDTLGGSWPPVRRLDGTVTRP